MDFLSLSYSLFSRSRFPFPLIEGAGIAGRTGLPVSGRFGNRGKRPAIVYSTGFVPCCAIGESRESVEFFPEIFPVLCFCNRWAFREENRPSSGTKGGKS